MGEREGDTKNMHSVLFDSNPRLRYVGRVNEFFDGGVLYLTFSFHTNVF